MLTVARRVRADIDWRQGDASALPLPDASRTVVLCQMALMFFPDRALALREMARAAAPGATVAVLVPSLLATQPAYGPFVDMACRHAGPQARALLNSYFSCGGRDELIGLFEQAGLLVAAVESHLGTARFPSVDALVSTEVASTPLGERISEEVYERIREGAHEVLAPFTTDDGKLQAPFECQVIVGKHPAS
jgi:SAM-dependent methyltransferase